MALKAKMVLPPKTTLQEFLDMAYANRSPELASKDAIFTVLEDNHLIVSWAGYDDVIYWTLVARALAPQWILYQ